MKRRRSVIRPVSAGGIVYRRRGDDTEVVICGRDDPSVWGLPKGTPDAGETREQTALREVREETGLEVRIEQFIGEIDYWFVRPTDGARCHKTVYYYLMSAIGGDLSLHDHEFDTVRWFPSEEACRTLTYENEVGIVQEGLSLVSKRPPVA